MSIFFFKIKKDSKYVKDVNEYYAGKKFIRDQFVAISDEFGLTSKSFYYRRDRLEFEPTKEDKKLLDGQFLKNSHALKKDTDINKRWLELMAKEEKRDYSMPFFPMFKLYFSNVPFEVMRSTKTLVDAFFDKDGCIWVAVDIPESFRDSIVAECGWLTEVSGVDFYQNKEREDVL